MKFSLRTLIAVTTLAGLACAALAKPSADWLTVVVSLTALAFAIQILRAMLQDGASRAAAAGWLLFAVSYLALVLAPWTREHVGPALLSSQTLQAAQTRWFPENPNAPAALSLVDGSNWPYFASNTSYALLQNLFDPSYSAKPSPAGYFHLSGHWLFAWVAGWLGAVVATTCYRRRNHAQAAPFWSG